MTNLEKIKRLQAEREQREAVVKNRAKRRAEIRGKLADEALDKLFSQPLPRDLPLPTVVRVMQTATQLLRIKNRR